MLDPIIISYKFTINVSVTYHRILQYPVNTTYFGLEFCLHPILYLPKKTERGRRVKQSYHLYPVPNKHNKLKPTRSTMV